MRVSHTAFFVRLAVSYRLSAIGCGPMEGGADWRGINVQDFRNLDVWRKAHELTLAVYSATEAFPSAERFGLTIQARRAVSSIATNLAEGCGRGSDADFARFVQIAMGSASEVEYELLLSRDLGYLKPSSHEELDDLVRRIKRMLTSLLRTVRRNK